MPRERSTDVGFVLRLSVKKFREGERELHCAFVDPEKKNINSFWGSPKRKIFKMVETPENTGGRDENILRSNDGE